MMRSLYAGVAGLKTHQTRMDVIGNNIANVNTTSYKSQSMTFSDLMYQTTQAASGANATTGVGGVNARQIGLGSKSGAIKTAISGQGASQTTNDPFDVMITGSAFFVVSNGTDNFFTRDGSFYVDGKGNLAMTSNGYNVMGWQPSKEDPTIIKPDTVTPLRIMSPDNMTYPPEATTEALVSGIVDKNDKNVNSESGKIMNLEFYDKQGYKYTAKLSVHAVDGDKGEFYVKLDKITDVNGDTVDTSTVTFGDASLAVNSAAKFKTDNKVDLDTTDPAHKKVIIYTADGVTPIKTGGYEVGVDIATASIPVSGDEYDRLTAAFPGLDLVALKAAGGSFTFTADGTLVTHTPTTVNKAAKLNYVTGTGKFDFVGAAGGKTLTLAFDETAHPNFKNINLDFQTTSNFNVNEASTINAVAGTAKGVGSGRKIGEMSGVSIGKDGMIFASYDNGQSRLLGQISTATFANASGLAKEGDNLYTATQNSGDFNGTGEDITLGGGYMNTGVLEMSNVDLSAEFTEMITTQRGFQANSRIITVSDTLLEELTNLKR